MIKGGEKASKALEVIQQLTLIRDRTTGCDPAVVGIPALIEEGLGFTKGIRRTDDDYHQAMPVDEAAAVCLFID